MNTTPPLALGIRDAAKLVGLSPWTLRDWIRQGRIASIRLGRRRLIEPSALHALVETARNAKATSV